MAGFFKKFVDRVSGYSDDDEYEDDMYEDEDTEFQEDEDMSGFSTYGKDNEMPYTQREPYRAPERMMEQPKVVPLKHAGDHQLVFIQPDSIKTAQSVCDHLRAGHTVICNIENVDAKIAQRVIDFISGAAHALDGNVKPIDAKAHSFVAAPKSVNMVDRKANERRYSQDFTAQQPYRSNFG